MRYRLIIFEGDGDNFCLLWMIDEDGDALLGCYRIVLFDPLRNVAPSLSISLTARYIK